MNVAGNSPGDGPLFGTSKRLHQGPDMADATGLDVSKATAGRFGLNRANVAADLAVAGGGARKGPAGGPDPAVSEMLVIALEAHDGFSLSSAGWSDTGNSILVSAWGTPPTAGANQTAGLAWNSSRAQGETVTTALLKLRITNRSVTGLGYIYVVDTNHALWSAGNAPNRASATASATLAVPAVGQDMIIDVTSLVNDQINDAGFTGLITLGVACDNTDGADQWGFSAFGLSGVNSAAELTLTYPS